MLLTTLRLIIHVLSGKIYQHFLFFAEVLSRAQSVSDALENLRKGSTFFKIRDKGVRGMNVYRRKYRLDINDMKIVYTPNKSGMSKMCAGGGGGGDAGKNG